MQTIIERRAEEDDRGEPRTSTGGGAGRIAVADRLPAGGDGSAEHVLDTKSVLAAEIELATIQGLADMDPLGSGIPSPAEEGAFAEGFQGQGWVQISLLPVAVQAMRKAAGQVGGQMGEAGPDRRRKRGLFRASGSLLSRRRGPSESLQGLVFRASARSAARPHRSSWDASGGAPQSRRVRGRTWSSNRSPIAARRAGAFARVRTSTDASTTFFAAAQSESGAV